MRLVLCFQIAIAAVVFFAPSAHASQTNGTIVSSSPALAWSTKLGWMNFRALNGNIRITDSGITGYAWSPSFGWTNLSPSTSGVHISANGLLSGLAWNPHGGWINFEGVSIDSQGRFRGQSTRIENNSTSTVINFDCLQCTITTDYRPIVFRETTGPSGSGISSPVAANTPSSTPRKPEARPVTDNTKKPTPAIQTIPQIRDNISHLITPIDGTKRTVELEDGTLITLTATESLGTNGTSISITPTPIKVSANATHISAIKHTFDITLNFGDIPQRELTILKAPLKLEITLPPRFRSIPNAHLYYHNNTDGQWHRVPKTKYEHGKLEATLDHLTEFALVSIEHPTDVLADVTFVPITHASEPEVKLRKNHIEVASDLSAQVAVGSNLTWPKMFKLEYVIKDPRGLVKYESKDPNFLQAPFNTEHTFTGLNLKDGDYTLSVIIEHDNTIFHTIQSHFTVDSKLYTRRAALLIKLLTFFTSLSLIFMLYVVHERRKKLQ